jgi:excinuclease ABC subunit B
VQPTFAQSTAVPGTRARKPTLDDMGSAANRPVPARAPTVDPRTKAGAYGEKVAGPHKPTLDEMGPHAERGLPVAGKSLPPKPINTLKVLEEHQGKKKHRHGRPRKTGRPGA